MPVERATDTEGPFYRWGADGVRYYFDPADESSRERAKLKAARAGEVLKARREREKQREAAKMSNEFPAASAIRMVPVNLSAADEWRMAFAWGEVDHPKGGFLVNRDFAQDMVSSFAFMRDTYGYYPPIGADHNIQIDLPGSNPDVGAEDQKVELQGLSYGIVASVETREDGIWVLPMYNELGDELNSMGAFLYVSPSFFPEYRDPHSGRILRNMLREFTQCTHPHQKNLKTPTDEIYGLSENGFVVPLATTTQAEVPAMATNNVEEPTDEPTGEPTDEPAPAEMDEKDVLIAELEAKIAELEELLAGGAEAPAEAPEAEVAMAEMRAEVKDLRRKLDLADAVTFVQSELPHADLQTVRDLAAMKLTNSKTSFGRWLERAKASNPAPVEMSEQGEVGAGGLPDGEKRTKLVALIKQAKTEEVPRKSVISYCTRRGYELSELDSDAFYSTVEQAYG